MCNLLKKVENKNKYKSADPFYYHLRDGDVDYLFSDYQLEAAKNRALSNPEDVADYEEPPNDFWVGFGSGVVACSFLVAFIYILIRLLS
jgi:hypothetical protein